MPPLPWIYIVVLARRNNFIVNDYLRAGRNTHIINKRSGSSIADLLYVFKKIRQAVPIQRTGHLLERRNVIGSTLTHRWIYLCFYNKPVNKPDRYKIFLRLVGHSLLWHPPLP